MFLMDERKLCKLAYMAISIQRLMSLRKGFASGYSRQMVQAPTGSGKTKIAAALAEAGVKKGNRVGFLVPRISLIDQTMH